MFTFILDFINVILLLRLIFNIVVLYNERSISYAWIVRVLVINFYILCIKLVILLFWVYFIIDRFVDFEGLSKIDGHFIFDGESPIAEEILFTPDKRILIFSLSFCL